MSNLEFLVRRYRQVVPVSPGEWADFPVRKISAWLADDVGPALEDFVRRPAFRERATWPLRALAPGASTPERQLVEQADQALVACAATYRRLAGLQTIRRRLAKLVPARPRVTRQDFQVTGSGSRRIDAQAECVDELPVLLAQIDQIAARFWADLVCLDDYFGPVGGWNAPRVSGATAGEFVVSLNPELHAGGDFVSRCLLRRVEVLQSNLESVSRPLLQACRGGPGGRADVWSAEVLKARRMVADAVARLRRACLVATGQPLRDACVLLTQIYAAFVPQPQLDWLGLPDHVIEHGAAILRHRVTHQRNLELVERTASALAQLSGLYGESGPREEALQEAIARGGLVLRQDPPALYWEGEEHPADWASNGQPWKFLWKLAEKAQKGAVVGERDLYEEVVSASTMGNLKSRLNHLVPASLRREIVPGGHDPRTYRLRLDASRICLEKSKPATR